MKRIGFLMLCFSLSVSLGWAQGSKVSFKEMAHDFGTVSEKGGNVTCEFVLTNNSDAPIVLSRVTASCGCTTPNWTKEPIAPGKTGIVSATYAPLGRPGPFSKSISVYTSAQDQPYLLTIKGEVVQEKRSPAEEYPFIFGNLRLKQNVLNLGQVAVTDVKKAVVEVFNAGTTPLSLKYDKLPKYVAISCEPAAIPANSAGKMTITYNAALIKQYGKVSNQFNIVVGNDIKGATNNTFYINASLVDNFSKMTTDDKTNAPKIGISTSQLNFGKLSDSGVSAVQAIKISNSGKKDLNLRGVVSDNPLIVVSKSKLIVKPGEIVDIKVTAQSKKILSAIRSTITIVSDDFNAPMKEVAVIAYP